MKNHFEKLSVTIWEQRMIQYELHGSLFDDVVIKQDIQFDRKGQSETISVWCWDRHHPWRFRCHGGGNRYHNRRPCHGDRAPHHEQNGCYVYAQRQRWLVNSMCSTVMVDSFIQELDDDRNRTHVCLAYYLSEWLKLIPCLLRFWPYQIMEIKEAKKILSLWAEWSPMILMS